MTAKAPAKTAPEEEGGEDEEVEGPEADKPMTFWEHLDELRKRVTRALFWLVIGCGVAWNYREQILALLVRPYSESWRENNLPGEPSLHFASPADAFLAYFNLSLIGGFALALPFISYQLWAFIAPGLYAREKRYVIPFVFCSSGLFIGGGYVGYVTAFKVTFGYLLSLSGPVEGIVNVTPTVMMADYIGFVMKMLLGFGVIFEIPVLFTFLALIGVVTHKKLIRWMRYYIFGAFLVAAVLTPPDWASQLVMAIPAVGLYFLSIGLVYIFQRKEALAADIEAEKEKEAEKKEKEEEERKQKEREKQREADRRKARTKATADAEPAEKPKPADED